MAKQASKSSKGASGAAKHHAVEAGERADERREAGAKDSVVRAGQVLPNASVQKTEPGEGGIADPKVVDQAPALLASAGGSTGSSAQVGDVPTRAVGSGFRKEPRTMANGVRDTDVVKDMALADEHAPDTIFLPGQTLLPAEGNVVVNLPYGSEPTNLDPQTGVVSYAARQRNEEADEVSGREVAKSDDAA